MPQPRQPSLSHMGTGRARTRVKSRRLCNSDVACPGTDLDVLDQWTGSQSVTDPEGEVVWSGRDIPIEGVPRRDGGPGSQGPNLGPVG